jgi:hypothetical protein
LEKKRAEQVLSRKEGAGEVSQTMYTYVSKCKNDKIKFKKYKNNVFKDVIFICNGILFSYKEE